MALTLKDRIYTECVQKNASTLTITNAKEGYQGWEALGSGANTYYCITDDTSWEIGHGIYTNSNGAQELTRNLIASNTGDLLNISGTASVFCTYPAEKSVYLDKDGKLDFPNVDTNFKHMVSRDITSGNVATSVVVVDGTEGMDDSDLAGLLNTYKKDEVDKLFMPKTGGWFTGGIAVNWKEPGYIVEPLVIFDNHDNKVIRMWNTGAIETSVKTFRDNDLVTKAYVDGKTDPTAVTCEQNWNNASWNIDNMVDALVSQIKVHNDRTALVLNKNGVDTTITKNWEEELAPYPSYFGIKIDEEIYYVEVEFTGKGGTNNRGYNFKILDHNLPETVENGTVVGICAGYAPENLTVADYNNFMPNGGTVTGQVTHKKDIFIEPTMPNKWINIKNRYATNADGSTAGAGGEGFGINFDLDHGNSGYNQVKWTNRSGDILSINGGSNPSAKFGGKVEFKNQVEFKKPYLDNESGLGFLIKGAIGDDYTTSTVSEEDAELFGVYHNSNGVDAINYRGKIDGPKNIVTREYVDDRVSTSTVGATIQTLNVREASYSENTDFSNPTDFFANNGTTTDTTELKFKQAYDHRDNLVNVVDYRETGATRVKVYERATADLVYDGIVKEILLESDIAVYKCLPLFTAVNHDWLRTSNKYTFILENIVEDK